MTPRQIAYFVPDVREAARHHSRHFGSGPFFVLEHVSLSRSEHLGVPRLLDHSSAYGQWGGVMIEFAMQHNPEASVFHDIYPVGSGRYGLHHVALFVDDLEMAIAGFARDGMPLAQWAETESGTAFAFVDAAERYGHMIELYEPSPQLTGFYTMVAAAAQGWDGCDPVRDLS